MEKSTVSPRGFTLVEILIVVAIFTVILGITSYAVLDSFKKANDKKRLAGLQTLQVALRLYKEAHGKYPLPGCGAGLMSNGNFTQGSTSPAGTNDANLWQWASPGPFTPGAGQGGRDTYVTCENYIEGLVPQYIAELPKDPASEYDPDLGFSYMTNFAQTEYKILIYGSVETKHPQRGDEFARCPITCPAYKRLNGSTQPAQGSPDWCFATPNYAVYSNTSHAACW